MLENCLPLLFLFQLTSSQGGRRQAQANQNKYQYFNSLPHKEEDKGSVNKSSAFTHFNSLPHKEEDLTRLQK